MSDFIYREPIKIVRDIIKAGMDLAETQIMLSNQKYFIPTVGLYVVLSYIGPAKVVNRNSELVSDGSGGMIERFSVNMLHMIQIDLMAYNNPSGGNDARERKEEIAMAMGSIYSQQIQQKYSMQVSRNTGDFTDTSFLEETEMMTRYTTTIVTTSLNVKQKTTNEYYDTFPGAGLYVDDPKLKSPVLAPPVIPVSA